jgi:iron(II)-dependent oxidoreductase
VDLVPVEAKYKVRRGGSWKSDPFSTSSYHRNFSFPFYASDFFGFRCAKSENSGASQ